MSNDFSAQEAIKLANSGAAVIIDMRTKEEIAAGSIAIAKAAPMDLACDDIKTCASKINAVAQGKDVILMCRSGARSKFLQNELAACGIQVGNLLGGIIAAANELEN